MEIIVGMHNIEPRHRGCVLTVGSFDGVHRGHKMLLEHLVAKGRELGAPSMLMTFEPTPREFFRGGVVPARLTRFREKITLLSRTELDRVLCLPFNERTASMDAEVVVEDLIVGRLGVRYLVVGDDFRFGQGARGDFAMLEAAGNRHGFGVSRMDTLTADDERISSTRVREALHAGDFAEAERLLGHPYFMMGRVVYGRQLGRQLGVPTANIRLQRYRTPLEGVFAVTVSGLDRCYEGVANVGVRPTVDGKEPLLEVHLFDFAEEIYGRLLTVEFKRKIRDERAFDGLDALKAQIARDIERTREYFARMLKWLSLAGAVVVADQLVKAWVVAVLAVGERIPVGPVLSWVRWHNEGAAFSMLSDASGWQRWFFVALALAFVAFIVYELRRLPADQRLMGWVYGLIAGGAIGNLIDRVMHGYVVDYVLLHWGRHYFPAFNVADAALTVGAILWIGAMIAEYRRERHQESS